MAFPWPVRFIRGAVYADWKLFPILRMTIQCIWNIVGFALFDGLNKAHTRIQKKDQSRNKSLLLLALSSLIIQVILSVYIATRYLHVTCVTSGGGWMASNCLKITGVTFLKTSVPFIGSVYCTVLVRQTTVVRLLYRLQCAELSSILGLWGSLL